MTKVTKILWWMKAYMRGRNGEGEEKERRTDTRRTGGHEERRTRGEKDTRREGHEERRTQEERG